MLDRNGTACAMPAPFSWDITHSAENCDSAELGFILNDEARAAAESACRLLCRENGRTVFCGVVDEYELRAFAGGGTLSVAGRGMAALLLDNEAEAGEYWSPGTAAILENHVYPWGIERVRARDMRLSGRFSVASGDSQWHVLREFCAFAGGITPRFHRDGTLLLNGEAGETVALVSPPVTEQVVSARRYGVFSHVLVKNRAAGLSATVENREFIDSGGLCRRVVNVPRQTGYDAMRYTGEYQIRQSKKGARETVVTLPLLFAAFAGDTVELSGTPLGAGGRFYVAESRCTGGADGARTRLTLTEEV